MIKGLCRICDNAGALNLLKKMQSSICKPNLVIYNTIIDSLCKDRRLKVALDLFSAMKSEGIKPDVVTYNALVRVLYSSGFRVDAKNMLAKTVGQQCCT